MARNFTQAVFNFSDWRDKDTLGQSESRFRTFFVETIHVKMDLEALKSETRIFTSYHFLIMFPC